MEEYLKRIKQLEEQVEHLKKENSSLEEKLNATLEGTGLCLWEQHIPSGTLKIFNREWGDMLGYQSHELDATVDIWKSKLHPDDYDLAVGAFEDHLNGKADTYQVIHRMIRKDGGQSWVSDRGRIVEYDENGKPLRMMGTHTDITNEKHYELELSKLAAQDPLTNLLNRKALETKFDEMNDLVEHPAALIFIDLDDFKTVNDHLGHQAGDFVLLQVSQWLQENAPQPSSIARLGGDEFVLLCINQSTETLKQFIDSLITKAYSPLKLSHGEVQIGFSIGVCQFTTSTHTFETLYELADQAMYQVKKNGKNGVEYINLSQ
ncbi:MULTISPECIES: diguanylate cyclase domain-containing protein [Vibrio]|uniref:diguanylate cyclase domain-containing protein n=1 Tax=Vibrio TaxID=662 RepID=UPI0014839C03|nr:MULTISPECIES: diguanylate cyclase [Vibrio]MDQ2164501.1 diguanylate cyclase [Vibrio anguillarum]NNN95905.1 diguanylate cyclase [Vibrio sp. B4-6]